MYRRYYWFPFPFYPPPAPSSTQRPDEGPPKGPPPKEIPEQGPSLKAVDPGAIRNCKYRYVYLWLDDGRNFWAWLTYVGRRSVAGYRWIGHRWVYFGTDLRNISDFICY